MLAAGRKQTTMGRKNRLQRRGAGVRSATNSVTNPATNSVTNPATKPSEKKHFGKKASEKKHLEKSPPEKSTLEKKTLKKSTEDQNIYLTFAYINCILPYIQLMYGTYTVKKRKVNDQF